MTPEQAELERIFEAVETALGLTREDLKAGQTSCKTTSAARRAIYIIMKERLGWGTTKISRAMNKSKTGVAHIINYSGCQKNLKKSTLIFHKAIENCIRAALSR